MDNKKSVDELFDIVIIDVDNLHKTFVDAAKVLGYSREGLIDSKSFWKNLDEASRKDTSLVSIVSSGKNILISLHDEADSIKQRLASPIESLCSVSMTFNSFLASSAATSSVVDISGLEEIKYEPNPFIFKDKESSADRFAKLDPALGYTYRQLEETLYATRSDG